MSKLLLDIKPENLLRASDTQLIKQLILPTLTKIYSQQTPEWEAEIHKHHLQLNKMEDPILRNIFFRQMVKNGYYCVFDLPEDLRKEILEKLCRIIKIRAQLCILADADTPTTITDSYVQELKDLLAPLMHVRDGVHVDRFRRRGYSCGFLTTFCDCIPHGGHNSVRVDTTQFLSRKGLNNGPRVNYCLHAMYLHGLI